MVFPYLEAVVVTGRLILSRTVKHGPSYLEGTATIAASPFPLLDSQYHYSIYLFLSLKLLVLFSREGTLTFYDWKAAGWLGF